MGVFNSLMTSASASNQSNVDASTKDDHRGNASSSYFQKTVCLQDWWLIKAEKDFEGRRLAVAGLTSREQHQALRVFSSAPILKRYDVFTLETIDGVCVLLKGFINKVCTEESGFPSEVFDHFVFGFPPYWEEYAEKCFETGIDNEDVSRITSGCDKLSAELYAKLDGVDDFSEGSPETNRKAINEECHDKGKMMDSNSECCRNVFSMNGQNELQDGPSNVSLVDDPKVHTSCMTRSHERACITKSDGRGNKRAVVDSGSKESENRDNAHRCKYKETVPMENSRLNAKSSCRSTRSSKRNDSEVDKSMLNVKRSRSGRVLLPMLEFWRNQRAIYDVNRQITGIQEGLHDVEPSRGSKSEPPRKRR